MGNVRLILLQYERSEQMRYFKNKAGILIGIVIFIGNGCKTHERIICEPNHLDIVMVATARYADLAGLASGSRDAQDRQRQAVQELALPLEVKTVRTGIVLRLIPAGMSTLGSPSSEIGREINESQRQFTLSEPFYCGKYEVTQGQWKAVMGRNPSKFKKSGMDAPVELISWDDCQVFVKKLCQKECVPEGTYRLLTDIEWEYACRAGTQSRFYFGDDDGEMYKFGNYCDRSFTLFDPHWKVPIPWQDKDHDDRGEHTIKVGTYQPNSFGLYDMHGNVMELCQGFGYFLSGAKPLNPNYSVPVFRGGGFHSATKYCRSANRTLAYSDGFICTMGFRIMRKVPSLPILLDSGN